MNTNLGNSVTVFVKGCLDQLVAYLVAILVVANILAALVVMDRHIQQIAASFIIEKIY